jgi:TPR repeat protein
MKSASKPGRANPIGDFQKYISELRRRVAQGDLSAMCDLGLWLQEGFQDKKGRSVPRSNPGYSFRLLKAAVEGGYKEAAFPLAYAYDVGLGTRRNRPQAVRWYTVDYWNGRSGGAANLAVIYRDLGDLRRAFAWWMRAAALDDGDAVDAGYCYQYGIGVRRNVASARRLFRRAIGARDISMWDREESLYHLAITYLDADKPKLAVPLLKRAALDGDYPEAAAVLRQLVAKEVAEPCRCRRFIIKTLRGHAVCAIHPKRTGHHKAAKPH